MNVLNIVEIEAITFLVILARMSAFLVAWPVLGSVNVPASVKVLLSVLLTMILFPMLKSSFNVQIETWQSLLFYVGKEVLIGLMLAFVSSLFFFVIAIASDVIGLAMGISSAKMFNPTMSMAMTPLDHFYYIFAALLFLILNFHHVFLTGLVHSYDVIPPSQWGLNLDNFAQLALFGQQILSIGLQLAAPVLVSILLINITLAIVGRAVPQINVLITSLPVNILVGLLVLIASVPFLMSHLGDTLNIFAETFFNFLKTV